MITNLDIGYAGRLGNQMFQYAVLFTLGKHKGYESFIPSINIVAVKNDGCMDLGTRKWIPYKCDLYDIFNVKMKTLPNRYFYPVNPEYVEPSFAYDENVFKIKDDTNIKGYFQSYKYFEKYESYIRDEFTFLPNIHNKCEQIIKSLDSYELISLHIRRGDYVAHPGFVNLDASYFQEAINKMYTNENQKILVFSDDIRFAKEAMPQNDSVIFIEGLSPAEDMCLMSMCNKNIISNSTFSWWAAYLNQNKDKEVVCPSKWFTDNRSLEDLYPNKWIII